MTLLLFLLGFKGADFAEQLHSILDTLQKFRYSNSFICRQSFYFLFESFYFVKDFNERFFFNLHSGSWLPWFGEGGSKNKLGLGKEACNLRELTPLLGGFNNRGHTELRTYERVEKIRGNLGSIL